MKKIGIITLNGLDNFGNRLQNFALQQFIEKYFNAKVFSIWQLDKFALYKIKIKYLFPFLTSNRRYNKFIKFNKKYVKNKFVSDINKINNSFDYFIVGSDQVWNPYFGLKDILKFLLFSPKEKNISFAASIGTDTIPNEQIKNYRIGLKNIKNISVREEKGKEIVDKLFDKTEATVLIDPTMLLDCDEWDKLIKKPKMLKSNKFILNYFLGNISLQRKQEILRIAKKYGCEIIDILDKSSPFYECGPREFLYLEKNAFLICTDSFHSSVFGILYSTPFLVFDREDKEKPMNSRIDTLLSKFKLEDRKYSGKINNKDLKLDCRKYSKILEEERKKAYKFLKDSFCIKDSD